MDASEGVSVSHNGPRDHGWGDVEGISILWAKEGRFEAWHGIREVGVIAKLFARVESSA